MSAPAYWLMKSEPGEWSWADQVEAKVATWEGVRNHQAANHMKAMRAGDRAFFYHTGAEKRIVGIVEIARLYYPDPGDETGRFGMVDVRAVAPVPRPVALAEIKAEPRLSRLPLVRQPRLSVMPVDPESWALLCRLAGIGP